MSLGSNIRDLRTKYNLSQEDIAKLCNVSSASVSLWELDKRIPRMGPIQKISDYFGITKSMLIDGTIDEIEKLPSAERRELQDTLISLLNQIPDDDYRRIVDFASALLSTHK